MTNATIHKPKGQDIVATCNMNEDFKKVKELEMTLAGWIIYNQYYEAHEVKYYAALNTVNLPTLFDRITQARTE